MVNKIYRQSCQINPDITWQSDKTVTINPQTTNRELNKPFKKITGTKFASILDKNPYSTKFETWCDITHTFVKDIPPNKYTKAGVTIEPKQADYCKYDLGMSNLIRPNELYGNNYFKRLKGNFFTDEIFGGMWDYLLLDKYGNPLTVLEMKTTKNVEHWKDDIPEYYALQASLYAYLLHAEQVYMVASFLIQDDYNATELYTPSRENTIIVPFKLHERYPNFETDYIDRVKDWYYTYIVKKQSPKYDLAKDKVLLKELEKKYGR